MFQLPNTPTAAIRVLTCAAALTAAGLAVPGLANAQGDRVAGSVSSVSGNTFEVARSSGNTTVSVNDTTRILEAVPAQRGEITVGTCIKAGGATDGDTITAKMVAISTTVDGSCPQRSGGAPAGSTSATHRGVRGVVEAISGDTITVAGASGPATVTVNDGTHYRRMITVSAPSISSGKCVAARGDSDEQGVLQATKVTVWSAGGDCPDPLA